jgi:23S rRNA A2030 N6-methylase RlmJ
LIKEKKLEWGLEKLSQEHKIPKEFSNYMTEVRHLEFD